MNVRFIQDVRNSSEIALKATRRVCKKLQAGHWNSTEFLVKRDERLIPTFSCDAK